MKSILVASDNEELAKKIKDVIGLSFGEVNLSCESTKYSMDLLKFKPDVLFLGFTSLNSAQDYLSSVKKMAQYFHKSPFTNVLLFTHSDFYVAEAMSEMGIVDVAIEYTADAIDALSVDIKKSIESHESIVINKINLMGVFPAENTANSDRTHEQLSNSGEVKSKPVILLVDDDPFIHTLTSKQIASEHYELMFAHDGEQALSVLANVKPDLIFMDVQMPKMTGVEVTRRIKDMPQTKDVPVVMLTGISDRDVVVSCMTAGAVDFLEKPFNKIKLNSKIESILLK